MAVGRSLEMIKNSYKGFSNYIDFQRSVYQKTKDDIANILWKSEFQIITSEPDGGWFLMLDVWNARSKIPEKYFWPGKYTDDTIP